MTPTARPSAVPEGHRPGRDRFAQAWARAVRRTSYVTMNWPELVAYLRGLTDQIIEMLVCEPFRTRPAYALGGAMVDAHFTGPRTLGRTLATLDGRLLADVEPELAGRLAEPEYRSRLATLLGEFAAGYAQALVQRTLDEQEGIRAAAIIAQANAEQRLRASDARLRAVFAQAGTGIGVADVDGNMIEANEALAAMLGYTTTELRRHRVANFAHPSDRAEICGTYQDLVAGERDQFRAEKRYFRKDGSELWADMSVTLIRDEKARPSYVVVMMHDVTERQRLHQRLRHQARHDPLTQLPNRMLFFDQLYDVFDAGEPGDRIGLCYLDLDGFKAVNDSLGHDIGDELLLRLANRLHERLAPVGHLVARIGGDEFVILVADCHGPSDALVVAESVMHLVREPVEIGGHQLRMTASIGVVEQPLDGTDAASLMKAADVTLYQAKSGGKNRWELFDAARDEREITRHTIAATMPSGLANGEFVIAYQPIVELATGRTSGAEALVGWRHPRFGRLDATQFVDLADETGLIDQLGAWVLRQSCTDAARWRTPSGPDRLVSVDVTTRQTTDPRFVARVHEALGAAGLPPGRLQLELTESVGHSFEEPALVENLRTLEAIGVRLVVDGFGAGHGNLSSLRKLPVQGFKIAETFVEALHPGRQPDPVASELVATMIDLAGRLGLDVTASGIDTQEQLQQLRTLGCRTGQGLVFGSAARELSGEDHGLPVPPGDGLLQLGGHPE